jgi:succinate-semialdehyde dehydrogenase / glutarate-semialdehyde dehydrogenase
VIDVEALTKRVVTVGPRDEIEVEQPFTGGRLGATPACTPEDVAAAIERAREAQRAWARTGFAERRAVLLRYHDLVLDRQDEILDVLQLESGKARRHAFEEVLDGAIVARYYANTAEDFLRARRRQGAFPVLTSTWEYHHPLGVIGIIAPWNYPLTPASPTPSRRSRPATASSSSPTGRPPSRPCGAPRCSRRPACRPACCRS